MGGGHSAETIKTGEDAHKYFLSTTSRSVVIELHNNTATEWKLQDQLILHGDKLLQNLPDVIEKDSINYICHGSNGFMTGVQAWASYMSAGGILMKLIWESDYIGISCITIETNNYTFTKTELESSNKNNLYYRVELKNIDF